VVRGSVRGGVAVRTADLLELAELIWGAGRNGRNAHGDGGLGAAFLDALDLIGGHARPLGQAGDVEGQSAALVIDGFAEGQDLADGGRSGSSACSGKRTQRVW